MTFYQDVGQRIAEILQERGMTQQDLANQLGISKQVMNKILHGEKHTTILELSQIAKELQVPIERFMSVNRPMYDPADLEFVPRFKGKVTTTAGREGLERAQKIIELILDHERISEIAARNRQARIEG